MIWLLAAVLLFFAGPAEATQRYMSENGATSGTCTTTGTACRFDRVVAVAACGDTVTILNGDGVYTGANNMLNFGAFPPANPTCTLGNEITFAAETDGGVFFNGEFARVTVRPVGISYYKFSGFDAGNVSASQNVIEILNSSNLTFQRICASNLQYEKNTSLEDVMIVWGTSANNLFEDMCLFGAAGNLVLEYATATTNTYRRMWLRWEGMGLTPTTSNDCGGPPFQIGYGSHQTSLCENIITVHSGEQASPGDPCYRAHLAGNLNYGSLLIRDTPFPGDTGYKFRGWISYGVTSPDIFTDRAWFLQTAVGGGDSHGANPLIDIQDMFIDALSQPDSTIGGPMTLTCTSGACSNELVDRVTTLRASGAIASTFENSGQYGLFTNINDCTTAAACPNFYTGGTSPAGARNCFRYNNGTLGSTPLWPWPMDDRIKAALARANAAGTGGTALSGAALTGAYAANTVTSEIVSRYGSVPTACLTSSSFTPNFPVASDFPSVTVRDDFNRANASTLGAGWTELLSDTFSIVSNAAAAPSTGSAFARSTYSDTKLQTSHEVYATWTTLPLTVGFSTILSFAGTDLTVNNQYRGRLDRASGANSFIEVRRVDGVGGETVILSSVDLGIEAAAGNSFGVRVSGTTISVYWKWTDGIWYRVGQFTDSNLSSLPSTGVYGGIAGGSPAVIDNFGAGPFVDQPTQEPPTPPASVGAGRFGTTFPGVH